MYTKKTAKALNRLKKITIIGCQITRKEDELLKLQTSVEYSNSSTEPCKTKSGDCNVTEKKMITYIAKKEKIQKKLDSLKKEYAILVKAFETLTTTEKFIIEENVIKGTNIKYLCEKKLYFSKRQLLRIKQEAIKKIVKCLSD